MRKRLTALLTALFLLLSGAAAWADYTEWKDSSYPFSSQNHLPGPDGYHWRRKPVNR